MTIRMHAVRWPALALVSLLSFELALAQSATPVAKPSTSGPSTASAAALTRSGIPAVDSAAVSRDAFSRANAAMRRQEPLEAVARLRHAAAAWPAQPSYPWALARVAASVGDTASVLLALEHLRRLDVTRALRDDSTLVRVARGPRFEALVRWNDSIRVAPSAGSTFRTIADSALWPEGADCTPDAATCWVSSVATRRVLAIATETGVTSLLAEELPGPVTAVRYDARRRVLWASTSTGVGAAPRAPAIAALLRIDPVTRRVTGRWEIPDSLLGPREHVLGDIAIADDGEVIVSDSRVAALYILRGDRIHAVRDPHFRSLQGIAAVPGSPYLIVADYSHGLLRVDRRDNSVRRLGDSPTGTTLGVDGLAWYQNGVIGVQNGVAPARIVRFTLNDALETVVEARTIDRNNPLADEPTGGTVIGDAFVYLSSSSWDKHDDDGRRIAGRALRSPVLLRVPLARTP